tara:strand:+ start:708 stop:1274 length:567 start_codon:yes stop_codon:yes gene_type:complete
MASKFPQNLKTICNQFGYNGRMLRILYVLIVLLAGCCSEKNSTFNQISEENLEFNESTIASSSSESELEEQDVLEVDDYSPRTLEEKWLDFKKRSKFSPPENLLYLAEELYDGFESGNNIRRMELSFFISQIYRNKGNQEKAKLYSEYYLNHLKSQQGGASFKAHQTEKSAVKSIMDKMHREGMGFDE